MATLVATHHNPLIRDFYHRLLERGKTKKGALVACMRKLPCILNAIVRDQKHGNMKNTKRLTTKTVATERQSDGSVR